MGIKGLGSLQEKLAINLDPGPPTSPTPEWSEAGIQFNPLHIPPLPLVTWPFLVLEKCSGQREHRR